MTKYSVIFDLDGVIVDSNPFHRKAWSIFLSKYGIEPTEEVFRKVIFGTTGSSTIRQLIDSNLHDAEVSALVKEVDLIYRNLAGAAGGIPALDGLLPLLHALINEGFSLAIATSAPPENVDLVLDPLGIRSYFDVIQDTTGLRHSKPHPEVYLRALQRLGQQPSNCIVFEDSLAGIRSARAASLPVVAITTGHDAETLINEGACLAIPNFRAVSPAGLIDLMNNKLH